jgi:hypothetical protein
VFKLPLQALNAGQVWTPAGIEEGGELGAPQASGGEAATPNLSLDLLAAEGELATDSVDISQG